MILLQLFLVFLQVGALSFGGGYAAMSLIHQQTVEKFGWLTETVYADLVTLSEMTPGPVAINAASFVGMRMGGIPGALSATLGYIVAPCLIGVLVERLYRRYGEMPLFRSTLDGIRPAVAGLIASVGFGLVKNALLPGGIFDAKSTLAAAVLFLAAFFVLRRFRVSPVPVILSGGVLGIAAMLCGII